MQAGCGSVVSLLRLSYVLLCCAVLCPCRKKRVNQAYLVAMMEMGIPKHKAEIALTETGNVGVEVATEWLFSTPDTSQFEQYTTSDTGEMESGTPATWVRGEQYTSLSSTPATRLRGEEA